MSYAFRCDRCGVFFNELKREPTEEWLGIHKAHDMFGKINLDLCVDCEKSLIKWMEEGAEQDDSNGTN